MQWPVIRDTLAAVVSAITSISPASVVWRGSPQATSIVVGTRAVLKIDSMLTSGNDETRYTVVPLNDQIVTRTGQRRFTWSVLIETQGQGPSDTARVLIDQVRIRLQRDSVITALSSVGLAVSTFAGTRYDDYLASGRLISWGAVDVYMLAVDNDTDDTQGSGDWINEAIIAGTVKDTSGNTLGTINEDVEG